jgi:glucokinase
MNHEAVIAGDIGGTNVRLSLVDREGNIHLLTKREVKEASKTDPLLFVKVVKEWISELIKHGDKHGLSVLGIGLGVAGKLDYTRGIISFSPNLPHLNGFPIVAELSESLSLPVIIENDANAFGLGEHWVGAAKNWNNWLGVTLGTGVGGCIFLNGRLWRGDDDAGFAGEIGHTTVVPEGLNCACGKRGCLEAYSSESGLIRQVISDIQNNWKDAPVRPSDFEYYLKNANSITAKSLYERGQEGDRYAGFLFERFGEALGIAIANIFTTLGIFQAVLGGGVSGAWDLFIPSLYKSLKKNCSMVDFSKIKITRSSLGDKAALLGAAKCIFDLLS